jgi:hypothetical protein
MNREDLSPERRLVLMASVEVGESGREAFEELVNNSLLQWGEVIYQMITHRTLNMLRYNLKKFSLFEGLEGELKRLMNMQWEAFRERNGHYAGKLKEILAAFKQEGLVVPVLKGNLLVNLVYPSLESRVFNDLDFLMKLDDVNKVTEVLERVGYIQGHFDRETFEITPATRKEKMVHQMTSHEIQEFLMRTDNRFAPLVEVDVNHDILWKGNCPYKVPTQDLIARAVEIDIHGVPGYRLDHADNVIQLSCHLYKEATLMVWITELKDLKLYKFADLHMYISKYAGEFDWDQLLERVRGYGLEKVVYYNFHYMTLVFGPLVPAYVMEALKPEDLTYLDEYAIENREPSVWEFDFFTRLFDVNRILSVDESQAAGYKRFVAAKFG